MITDIPTFVLYAVGFLIISNLGVIITLAVWGGKAIWWASNMNSEVRKMGREMTLAHENIRKNSEKIYIIERKIDKLN